MSYIMVVTFTLVLLSSTLLGSASGASSPDCCRFKEVGGVKYALAGIQDTSAYNCLSPCVYMMADDINRSEKYCFAAGDLEVVCGEMANNTDDSGLGGCKCGKKKDERIVGGAEADINEWPWMVSMLFSDGARHKCGGTVVASEWIVTAAHCLYEDQELIVETKFEDVSIVLGEHDNFLEGEEILPRKVVKISKYIKHPEYDKLTSNADIALLKLAEKVDLNTYTPACMANTGDDFVGKTAWVYGWGALSYGTQDYPDKLQELSVKIVSQEVCQAAHVDLGWTITDGMLCAGGVTGQDSCQGDSGGPLTLDINGQHHLIGDVSFGDKCALEGRYGIYAKTSFFRKWIDETFPAEGGATYCPAP